MQKPVRAPNGSGGFITTWSDVINLWCEITLPTGRIAPVAEQVKAIVTAEIRVRPRADAVAGNRLVEVRMGVVRTYLIEAALLDNETTMLRLLCSNVPNP
jgi:head-tail adaptor